MGQGGVETDTNLRHPSREKGISWKAFLRLSRGAVGLGVMVCLSDIIIPLINRCYDSFQKASHALRVFIYSYANFVVRDHVVHILVTPFLSRAILKQSFEFSLCRWLLIASSDIFRPTLSTPLICELILESPENYKTF